MKINFDVFLFPMVALNATILQW